MASSKANRPDRRDRQIALATLLAAGIAVAASSSGFRGLWKAVLLGVGIGIAFAAFLGLLPTLVIVRVVIVDMKDLLGFNRHKLRSYHRWNANPFQVQVNKTLKPITLYLHAPTKLVSRYWQASLTCTVAGLDGNPVMTENTVGNGAWQTVLPPDLPAGDYRVQWTEAGKRVARHRLTLSDAGVLGTRRRESRWRRFRAYVRSMSS